MFCRSGSRAVPRSGPLAPEANVLFSVALGGVAPHLGANAADQGIEAATVIVKGGCHWLRITRCPYKGVFHSEGRESLMNSRRTSSRRTDATAWR